MAAAFEQNSEGLFGALEEIKKIPDGVFSDILTDEQKMHAIQDQFTRLNSNRKVGDGKASIRFFDIEDDRDLLNRMIVYYKARIDWTNPQQQGIIKKNITCFGQDDAISWINDICNNAGISFTKPAIKTEQEKDAEQAAGRDAVEKHLSGKKKPVRDQQKPIPTPEIVNQVDAIPPEIGTAFLANNMQFVFYKPSEAYQMPERSAIIDKYFYADTISLLYGQAGSFKTWFALWEGVSLALGKELCGMPINDGDHRILYISLEMTAKGLADRLQGMTKDLTEADREKVNENFVIISAESTSGMKANDEFLTALSQICTDQRFDVIYIDSFADFIAGYDIRSENDMTAIIDKLRTFVLQNHVSFRIIHHGTKPTQDSNGSMAGIHTIRDLVDYVFLIKADAQNEIKVTSDMQDDRSAKSRYSEPMKMTMKFVSDTGSYSFKQIQDVETSSFIEKVRNVRSVISDNEGITNGELRKLLGNPKDLSKILSGMVGNTIIEDSGKSEKGQKTKVYYTVEYWNENIKP